MAILLLIWLNSDDQKRRDFSPRSKKTRQEKKGAGKKRKNVFSWIKIWIKKKLKTITKLINPRYPGSDGSWD